MYGLFRILVKELQQLRHDRMLVPAMIIGPLVQLLAFGFAANTDVSRVPMLLVDRDHTQASRELVRRFTSSGYFRLVGTADSVAGIEPWLVDGRAQVALVVGEGYQADLHGGRAPSVQVVADGTDAASAVVGLGYASRIVAAEGARLVRARLAEARAHARRTGMPPVRAGRIELVPRVWYNPDLKSRWFYVPAILALTLLLLTMILPSMAVVREKEVGTMEQLIVTPLRPWQLIVGKLLPFFGVGLVDLVVVTGVALAVFRVPLRGSFGTLLLLTLPFLLTALGLGLLASTMVRTQQQAMMASTFLLMVPMIYLSGLIFPIENMPEVIRWATYAVPLRYYNHVIRGVFLKGAGLDSLWREGVILTGFGIAALTAASFRFRKSLD